MKKIKNMKKGFTLIELLVVIAIIAILAGLIITRLSGASGSARNSRRQSDLAQIRTAIEQAKNSGASINTTGCTPPIAVATPCDRALADGLFTLGTGASNPSAYLTGSSYPKDPLTKSDYRLLITSGTAPNSNYFLRANATDDGAAIDQQS